MNRLAIRRTLAFVSLMKCATSAFSLFPKRPSLVAPVLSSYRLTHSHHSHSGAAEAEQLSATHPLTSLLPFSVGAKQSFTGESELLIVPFFESSADGDFAAPQGLSALSLPAPLSDALVEALAEMNRDKKSGAPFAGGSAILHVFPAAQRTKRLALLKLTERPTGADKTTQFLTQKAASDMGKAIAVILSKSSVESASVAWPGLARESVAAMVAGIHDGLYADKRFKGPSKAKQHQLAFKALDVLGAAPESVDGVETANRIASGVNLAKDIVGAPSNWKTPDRIAEIAQELSREHGLDLKILGLDECKSLGMRSYLAVQQGSKFPPRFVHLTYKGKTKDGAAPVKIALVGKGLTFDSGGYNLKSGAGSMIELMKFDVGGCAAVLGCAKAIAQLKPENLEVHFISPVCENMISSEAMRPGDIVQAMNGKTIEIINTDAEGRLALADALCYAEKLGVNCIVDVATLTGACIMGLGENIAGLYSTTASLKNDLENAAKQANELIWCLPLEKSYKKAIKSNIADLRNLGSNKGGGSITAALFLREFVGKTPWAHLDIAGPVWDYGANKPTGFGVKLLVQFLMNFSATNNNSSQDNSDSTN